MLLGSDLAHENVTRAVPGTPVITRKYGECAPAASVPGRNEALISPEHEPGEMFDRFGGRVVEFTVTPFGGVGFNTAKG